MSLADFLTPINTDQLIPEKGFNASQLGSKIDVFTNHFPDLEEARYDIALIGVLEDRNAVNNEGCADGPDKIREKLYSLYEGNYTIRIADLGNIARGESVTDSYIALKTVINELVRANVVPIILGGGQDLTYAQYMAYEDLEMKVDLVVIDKSFDLDDEFESAGFETTSEAFLSKILLHEPNYLFNFSNLGYQTYFTSQESLRVMDKLLFDVHRLGELSGNVSVAEPVIRNAGMVSFDVGAIKASDAMGNGNASPNGFYGEEACQLCRYAGFNDKLTSIGFYEYNPKYDDNGRTAMLLAQMIWYFIEGFYNRKSDFPLNPRSHYLIYKTTLKHEEHELVFVKSKKSDRWWMQVPYPSNGSANERSHLVPCRYEDYKTAVDGEMPDLWWRTYQKLS
ncbi:formimidoylglutamase [Mucilaginibacter ginkgonis]|uniref:Formimidoylglutamase n=1 Tax=Mucilaginibacter ginkgonis TaxID=2682091 RepID=A0A6I4I0W3_9SPHI|nr:formimidoylglutamase [Mucilaginibacter ginkgonis]QQL48752.1 formimidoylglutamase [Mucilaginibacter ginkgonis]